MAYMDVAYMVMAYMVVAYMVVAYIVMAYTVMAYMVMAYMVVAYMVMAYILMTCMVVAYTIMPYVMIGYVVMTYMVMAYIIMAYIVGTVCGRSPTLVCTHVHVHRKVLFDLCIVLLTFGTAFTLPYYSLFQKERGRGLHFFEGYIVMAYIVMAAAVPLSLPESAAAACTSLKGSYFFVNSGHTDVHIFSPHRHRRRHV